jgi:hypothetical protein
LSLGQDLNSYLHAWTLQAIAERWTKASCLVDDTLSWLPGWLLSWLLGNKCWALLMRMVDGRANLPSSSVTLHLILSNGL